MHIAKVIANVVSTIKHPAYRGRKLLMVRKIHPLTGDEGSDSFLAVDFVDAGVGDIVLVSQEGSAARDIIGNPKAPVRSFIVAIVEDWKIENTQKKNG